MRFRIHPILLFGLAALIATLALLSACAQAPDTSALDAEHARLEANKALFHRFFDEVINKGNLDLIDEMLSPDMVDHEPQPPGSPSGREGVRQFFGMIRTAFPDLHASVDHIVAEGDFVVIVSTWSGTQEGEFMGVPASGNQVTWPVWDMIRIVDGVAVEHWGLSDAMTMMIGIGAMPPPAGMMP